MHESHQDKLNPSHPAPVGRLKLEIVNLKNQGLDSSVHGTLGTATSTITITATLGSFADEE